MSPSTVAKYNTKTNVPACRLESGKMLGWVDDGWMDGWMNEVPGDKKNRNSNYWERPIWHYGAIRWELSRRPNRTKHRVDAIKIVGFSCKLCVLRCTSKKKMYQCKQMLMIKSDFPAVFAHAQDGNSSVASPTERNSSCPVGSAVARAVNARQTTRTTQNGIFVSVIIIVIRTIFRINGCRFGII